MNDSSKGWSLVDVRDDGVRFAARGSNHCLYCEQVVGQPHLHDCDTIKKIVRVRCIVEVDVYAAHCASKEDIEQDEIVRWDVEDALEVGGGDIVHLEFAGVVDETPWRALHEPRRKGRRGKAVEK